MVSCPTESVVPGSRIPKLCLVPDTVTGPVMTPDPFRMAEGCTCTGPDPVALVLVLFSRSIYPRQQSSRRDNYSHRSGSLAVAYLG